MPTWSELEKLDKDMYEYLVALLDVDDEIALEKKNNKRRFEQDANKLSKKRKIN